MSVKLLMKGNRECKGTQGGINEIFTLSPHFKRSYYNTTQINELVINISYDKHADYELEKWKPSGTWTALLGTVQVVLERWHRCYELIDNVSNQIAKNIRKGGGCVGLYSCVSSCRNRVVNVDLAQFGGSSLRFVQSAPPRQTSTTVRAPERLVLNAWRLVSATGAVRMCTPS